MRRVHVLINRRPNSSPRDRVSLSREAGRSPNEKRYPRNNDSDNNRNNNDRDNSCECPTEGGKPVRRFPGARSKRKQRKEGNKTNERAGNTTTREETIPTRQRTNQQKPTGIRCCARQR